MLLMRAAGPSICLSQHRERLFDIPRLSIGALDMLHHQLSQHSELCGAICRTLFGRCERHSHGTISVLWDRYGGGERARQPHVFARI